MISSTAMLIDPFRVAVWSAFIGFSTQAVLPADSPKWEAERGYRRLKLNVPSAGRVGFTLMSGEITGLAWTNQVSMGRYTERQNMMNGSGLALGDFDSDGWCDIYLCNKEGPNALYRNLGNWTFENVAARAGVTCTNQSSTGATFADVNGDGRLDLLVNSFTGPNACFLNLGAGRFTNVTAHAGLISKGGTTSLALGDLDGDGDLDLYVCYFGIEAILRDGGSYTTREVNGKVVVTGRYAKRLAIQHGRIVEFGEPDILFLNDGHGRFTPVDWKQGFRDENDQPMTPPPDFGLAVQVRDINADGAPDIYVCNDFQTPDRVWLNDGQGRFRAIDRLALRNMSYASMGADFADIDRDGALDFFAVEMLSRNHWRHLNQSSPISPLPRPVGSVLEREEFARNTLCWNRGDGTYAEIGWHSGVAASDWSWTPLFLDVDLDGYEDLLITNGHMHDVNDRDVAAHRAANPSGGVGNRKLLLQYPRLDSPNAAYHNQRNLTFADTADLWGFNSRRISHGMALADLDNDGDLDVVANCINDPPLIYRNDGPAPRIAVRLKGRAPNIQGIGGKITLFGGPVTQSQEIICGGNYLSGGDPMRTFAAGGATPPLSMEVVWRTGAKSVVKDVLPNYLYEIDEAGASPGGGPGVTHHASRTTHHASPIFQDVSDALSHRHVEEAFDDFARQPLLPRKLSQLGPGVAWLDLDQDGDDDLVVGSGKGGSIAVFRNNGKGGFTKWNLPAGNMPLVDDAAGLAGWNAGDGKPSLLVGLSNYETTATNSHSVLRYDFANGTATPGPPLPGAHSSSGPLAVADVDGDGDLDLFVGGRVIAGRYPQPASSRLFRNEQGKLVLDSERSKMFEGIGMVSGAVFSDLNSDGRADLVLACEWGPIRVFRNEAGVLKPWDAPVVFAKEQLTLNSQLPTLSALTGWWNSVATGDLDGDGRLDIIAGNWGMNSFYNRAPKGPWRLYYGDFNGDGQVHILEAYANAELQKIVPWRDLNLVAAGLPWIRERITSHKAYARASVTEILGDHAAKAQELRATTLESMVFFNRTNQFEVGPLPVQAQWAPVHGLNVGDMDGDGHEDVFLSQNLFALRMEDNRLDAGRGLWLRGDGKGGLKAVAGQESGVAVYGEQRGSALADYDADGRVDLVVTQNGTTTKLYRNVQAKPGLRVRLRGSPANPNGVGATIRLVCGQKPGPAREVRAGSGYWSQDSVVQVLGAWETPTHVWIRWPGGKEITASVPKGAREILVDPDGRVTAQAAAAGDGIGVAR